jgi:hypothetical protein
LTIGHKKALPPLSPYIVAAKTAAPTLFQILTHFFTFQFMFPPIVLLKLAMFHQCIGGTGNFSPIVIEMQTGSTNKHIS